MLMGRKIVGLSVTCLLGLLAAPRGEAASYGKHVILLIDDSGDARGMRAAMVEKLPRWLFRGPDPNDPSTPRFDPQRDTLSVLYFALSSAGPADACKQMRGDEISADTVLSVENIPPEGLRDEGALRQRLSESLARPCRFGGHLSPIITAQFLALPFVQKQLPPAALFTDVLVATATNDSYNFSVASPAAELSRLESDFKEFHVRVPDATRSLVREVAATFGFDSHPRWSARDDRLHYDVLQVVPRGRTPDSALLFNRRIQMDRVAVGGDRILGMPKIPGTGDVRIPRGELVPLSVSWRLETDQRQPWPSSQAGKESGGTLDLTQCKPPVCVSDDAGTLVRLFEPSVNPVVQASGEAPFGGGALAFRTAFRLTTDGDLYNHFYLQSQEERLSFTPVPRQSVWMLAFPITVDNARLTSLWFSFDGVPPEGGISQDKAVNRLRTLNVVAWSVAILVLLLLAIRAAYRSRVFTFEPELTWAPSGEIVLDFDRPGKSRLLVGSLTVRNGGRVGWLGRRLGHAEQPTRTATIELAEPETILTAAGVQLQPILPIGFLDNDRRMVRTVTEVVSDGRQIHLFLAEEAITDYVSPAGEIEPEVVIPLEIRVQMRLRAADVAAPRFATVAGTAACSLRLKAETPRVPRGQYVSDAGKRLDYGPAAHLRVGRFVFNSTAVHRFALPFLGSYEVTTSCEGRPLAGSPIVMLPSILTVASGAAVPAAVELHCEDGEVRNPEPASNHYEFVLRGPHDPDYAPGDLSFDVHRDPARAEIELHLKYKATTVEVYWDAAKRVWNCRGSNLRAPRPEVASLRDGILRFGDPFHYEFDSQGPTPTALDIKVGNSAKSGKGVVEVKLAGTIAATGDAGGRLHMREGRTAADILEMRIPRGGFVVREGQATAPGGVRLHPEAIESIDGGEIEAKDCTVRVTCAVVVTTDNGDVDRRSLEVEFPIHLEQSLGQNWLVIDFGTSSIAAAVGTAGAANDRPLLDLQHLKVYQNESISSVDENGPEHDTPFLPSWINCDGDDRRVVGDERLKHLPPGFPGHTGTTGASLLPSSPSFITLPAQTFDLQYRPERVVLSLKSWLGVNAEYVQLLGEVSCQNGADKPFKTRALPLDDLMEASYAALAEAYLKQAGPLGARQVVLCHPNTFSDLHCERLRGIARRALLGRLNIPHPKHIKLLSESDAVAYAYCWERMGGSPPSGTERVLVYDLGAGTLDLSIIRIEWNRDPVYPIFRERHHMGVAVAGNYFDEVIARIVDELLSKPEVRGTSGLQYSRPVVSSVAADRHQSNAARSLWNEIRQAKHQWVEGGRFEVTVGKRREGTGLVDWDGNRGGELPPSMPLDESPLVVLRDGKFVLSMPSAMILRHPRVVRLLEFLAREVPREALSSAGLSANDVNTLIVSGRGALWPGLVPRLLKELPKAVLAQFMSSDAMKAAVVRGAIARQDFDEHHPIDETRAVQGRLAVVYGRAPGTTVLFEDQWDKPINIPFGSFRLVRIGIKNPDPKKDLNSDSLRRHFYVGVGRDEYLTKQIGRVLTFKKEEESGDILITNEEGVQHRVGPGDTVQHIHASWPVGHAVLSPTE